ncbi:MAG TPA: MFS transporter, partial [Streptosporangiaceae bacterium]|nr:MFS transporter [Streptosporangiaceae bacterium]
MVSHRLARRPGLLRAAPDFRWLWLSRTVSFTGDGIARVALVLLAAPAGPEAVSLILLANSLPRLLGPVAGAVADRVDQRRLMAGCELGQAAIYATVAAARPHLPVLLPLVAATGLLATLFSPAGKGSVPKLVPADRLGGANALLASAFNLQVIAGPAIGGVLVGFAGTSAAFAADAGSFLVSALLLSRMRPLPAAGAPGTGLAADTIAGLRYAARAAVPRALVLGTVVFVAFAAMDNVALV